MKNIRFNLIRLFLIIITFADSRNVEGKIKNQDDDFLTNANVISLPSGVGTQSDNWGYFSLSIPDNDEYLIFSFIGYLSDTILVKKILPYNNIILKKNVIQMEALNVKAKGERIKNSMQDNELVSYINMDGEMMRSSFDLGDGLQSNYPIFMNETVSGAKNISFRGLGSEELILYYDGVRINNFSNSTVDLSRYSSLGLDGIQLMFGNTENSLSSSGAINLVPKILKKNTFSFNQKFGTYDYGGYDTYGSIGNKKVSLNSGFSEVQFKQRYQGSYRDEVITSYNKKIMNTSMKVDSRLLIKMMIFENGKKYVDRRANDSLDLLNNHFIFKLDNENKILGDISFYGSSQECEEIGIVNLKENSKSDLSNGFGMKIKRKINHASFGLSIEQNRIKSNHIFYDDKISANRNQYGINFNIELIGQKKISKVGIRNIKIMFNQEEIDDSFISQNNLFNENKFWKNNNSKIFASIIDNNDWQKLLFITYSSSNRVPSIDEIIKNKIGAFLLNDGLLNEKKSMFEFGYKIHRNDTDKLKSVNTTFKIFSYQYIDKIKHIYYDDSILMIPVNYGNEKISGYEFALNIKNQDFIFNTFYVNHFFSDQMAFQLYPKDMLRLSLQLKYLKTFFKLIYRKESQKFLTSLNSENNLSYSMLDGIQTFDLAIDKKIKYRMLDLGLNFSAKNLNSPNQELIGVSVYDRRYVFSISLLIM